MLQVALKMLFGDRGKYLGIVIGIALASVLMIQQPGIWAKGGADTLDLAYWAAMDQVSQAQAVFFG